MNSWWILLATSLALLVVFAQQSNGLESEKNDDPANPKRVLEYGFSNLKSALETSEKEVMDGFSLADRLVDTQPTAAAQAIKQGIHEARHWFYDAGEFVFQCLGEAMGLSGDSTRQALVEISENLQVLGIEALSEMRNGINMVNDGISVGGDVAKQAIENARQTIEAGFVVIYGKIPIFYQEAIKAVSGDQPQSEPLQDQAININADAAAKDNDTLSAIAEVNKAAADSINRGASSFKVNQLKDSVISSLCAIAKVTSDIKDYSAFAQKLSETDPPRARKLYMEGSKAATKRIHNIFANAFLDFGAAGVKADSSTQKQIGRAIRSLAHGKDDWFFANKITKKLTILATEFDGYLRTTLLNAADQSGNYGKITSEQRIVQAAKIAFNSF